MSFALYKLGSHSLLVGVLNALIMPLPLLVLQEANTCYV